MTKNRLIQKLERRGFKVSSTRKIKGYDKARTLEIAGFKCTLGRKDGKTFIFPYANMQSINLDMLKFLFYLAPYLVHRKHRDDRNIVTHDHEKPNGGDIEEVIKRLCDGASSKTKGY